LFEKANINFEQCGFDVLLAFNTPCHRPNNSRDFAIELKPSMGDDYPAVMRQIKKAADRFGSVRKVCVIGKYVGVGATYQQVKEMFKISDIELITVSEIDGVTE
jgi:hypothetical protein